MSGERKAIALLSGGLDSSLAVKMMLDQGIEVAAVNFTSPFCNCTPHSAGCQHQASGMAAQFGIEIQVLLKGMDYMRIVENPPHGHGRGMNPCIDCRIYMLRKAKELMARKGASFVVTGEVLGQRPMSQHRQAMRIIEKESGLAGYILRPLSARHFPPTVPEQEGIVDRDKLLSFSGRSRKPQIALAAQLGVKDYPCPAGGCLLTDAVIAERLRDLFAHVPDYALADLHLLKVGRHFRLHAGLKIILGRNQTENERIRSLAGENPLFQPADFRGPTALARGKADAAGARRIGEIMARYSQDEKKFYTVEVCAPDGEVSRIAVTRKCEPEALEALRVEPGKAPSFLC